MTALERAEAATFWVGCGIPGFDFRARGVPVTCVQPGGRAVFVGANFFVTRAHICSDDGMGLPTAEVGEVDGTWLHRFAQPLIFGGRMQLSISCDSPGDGQSGGYPTVLGFGDPSSDTALLMAHVGHVTPVPVRRAPLRDGETVHVFADGRGWIRAVASPRPGPLIEVSPDTPGVFRPGDCGGPIIDDAGELVAVASPGVEQTRRRPGGGFAGELCRSLPRWALDQIWAADEGVRS